MIILSVFPCYFQEEGRRFNLIIIIAFFLGELLREIESNKYANHGSDVGGSHSCSGPHCRTGRGSEVFPV